MQPDTFAPVPARYHGVWVRTLLQTPTVYDTTTFVRWMQTSRWHADVRVPTASRSGALPMDSSRGATASTTAPTPQQRASQQGFCGVTEISQHAGEEICTWHRRMDFQPPRPDADTGTIQFETSERLIERGIHATYHEVWERLPDSVGRCVTLAGYGADGSDTGERLLQTGSYLMHVRPRTASWPADTLAGDSLQQVVTRHPAQTEALLDFEISFGRLEQGVWSIECSTLPHLEGQQQPMDLQHLAAHNWVVLEWSEAALPDAGPRSKAHRSVHLQAQLQAHEWASISPLRELK